MKQWRLRIIPNFLRKLYNKYWVLQKIFLLPAFSSALSEAGVFIKHQKHGIMQTSEFWKKLGYSWMPNGREWMNLVHPDDLQRIEEEWDKANRGALSAIQTEFRILRADGVYEWVVSKFWVLERNRDRSILSYLGMDLSLQAVKSVHDDIKYASSLAYKALEDGNFARTLGLNIIGCQTWDEFWKKMCTISLEILPHSTVRVIRIEEDRVLANNPHIGRDRPQFILLSSIEGQSILQSMMTLTKPQVLEIPQPWFQTIPSLGQPELLDCVSYFYVPLFVDKNLLGALIFGQTREFGYSTSDADRVEILLDFLEPATRSLNKTFWSGIEPGFSSRQNFINHVEQNRLLHSMVPGNLVVFHIDYPMECNRLSYSFQFQSAMMVVHDRLQRFALALDWAFYIDSQDTLIAYMLGAIPENLAKEVLVESRNAGFPLTLSAGLVESNGRVESVETLIQEARDSISRL